MSSTMNRRPVLVGAMIAAVLVLAGGAVVLPRLGHAAPAAVTTPAGTGDTGTAGAPPSSEPQSSELASATAADPTPSDAAPSEAAPSVTPESPPATTDIAAPAAPAASSAPSRPAPGQRVDPTSAEVQAAIDALHQRIPLFAPTDQQLRTFAEAVCASFDQGQTEAQVQSTVQEAVSHIQGASLSSTDADFAVRTVVQLRCPGSLP